MHSFTHSFSPHSLTQSSSTHGLIYSFTHIQFDLFFSFFLFFFFFLAVQSAGIIRYSYTKFQDFNNSNTPPRVLRLGQRAVSFIHEHISPFQHKLNNLYRGQLKASECQGRAAAKGVFFSHFGMPMSSPNFSLLGMLMLAKFASLRSTMT